LSCILYDTVNISRKYLSKHSGAIQNRPADFKTIPASIVNDGANTVNNGLFI